MLGQALTLVGVIQVGVQAPVFRAAAERAVDDKFGEQRKVATFQEVASQVWLTTTASSVMVASTVGMEIVDAGPTTLVDKAHHLRPGYLRFP